LSALLSISESGLAIFDWRSVNVLLLSLSFRGTAILMQAPDSIHTSVHLKGRLNVRHDEVVDAYQALQQSSIAMTHWAK
jgi:hypothetical protein